MKISIFSGGPYASFAGRDASRNLATFSVAANEKDEYDDLSDLSAMEMDSVREWEMQFKGVYLFLCSFTNMDFNLLKNILSLYRKI